jgi:hypothetical protein
MPKRSACVQQEWVTSPVNHVHRCQTRLCCCVSNNTTAVVEDGGPSADLRGWPALDLAVAEEKAVHRRSQTLVVTIEETAVDLERYGK